MFDTFQEAAAAHAEAEAVAAREAAAKKRVDQVGEKKSPTSLHCKSNVVTVLVSLKSKHYAYLTRLRRLLPPMLRPKPLLSEKPPLRSRRRAR